MISLVAPLVGAWIEIFASYGSNSNSMSLPLWERGLKFRQDVNPVISAAVAPLVGAWIEILAQYDKYLNK